MATNVYEAMIIFDANRFARDREALAKEVEQLITSQEGEVVISRLWEERKLAYPINGQRKGTYWLIYFRSDASIITGFNRQCEINENILRHLVLKIHPHLQEAILEHASQGRTDPAPEEAEAAAGT